jgi:hypothetical protein
MAAAATAPATARATAAVTSLVASIPNRVETASGTGAPLGLAVSRCLSPSRLSQRYRARRRGGHGTARTSRSSL